MKPVPKTKHSPGVNSADSPPVFDPSYRSDRKGMERDHNPGGRKPASRRARWPRAHEIRNLFPRGLRGHRALLRSVSPELAELAGVAVYFSLSSTFGSFQALNGQPATIEHRNNPNVDDRAKYRYNLRGSFRSLTRFLSATLRQSYHPNCLGTKEDFWFNLGLIIPKFFPAQITNSEGASSCSLRWWKLCVGFSRSSFRS
jgi:hypothetical protein